MSDPQFVLGLSAIISDGPTPFETLSTLFSIASYLASAFFGVRSLLGFMRHRACPENIMLKTPITYLVLCAALAAYPSFMAMSSVSSWSSHGSDQTRAANGDKLMAAGPDSSADDLALVEVLGGSLALAWLGGLGIAKASRGPSESERAAIAAMAKIDDSISKRPTL